MATRSLVSILVPVYKSEKFLPKCIESILNQTYSNFELILVDDGSPDNSGSICDEYADKDSRIKVFHKTNGGVSSARNHGLKNSNGEWIFFMDSDDWISPNLLELCINKLESGGYDIVNFNMIFCRSLSDDSLNYKVDLVSNTSDKVEFIKTYLLYRNTSVCSLIAKKEIYTKNELCYNENISIAEDFDITTKLYFYANKIAHVDDYLYYYNITNSNSIMHNVELIDKVKRQESILTLIDFFKRNNAYEVYERELCMRVLESKQELVMSNDTIDCFMQIYPQSHKYILEAPISKKLKIIMWMLTHKLGVIARIFVWLWNIVKKRG